MRLGPHDDLELLDSIDHAPTTLTDADLDDDLDDDALPLEDDSEPVETYRRPAAIKLTPRLRKLRADVASGAIQPSWWTLPDANYAREAERMAMNPKAPKIPGSNNVIGWRAVF